jgi:chromosome segregation ATPase
MIAHLKQQACFRSCELMLRKESPPAPPVEELDDVEDEEPLSPSFQTNGINSHSISSAVALGFARSRSNGALSPSPPPDTTTRLDALAKERDTLRQQVTELRKSLESIQGKHEEELGSLQGELDEANEGKDHFETQYRNLLGRVNTIKSSLGDRLKADAAKLEEAQITITDLEDQSRELQGNNNSLTEELAKLRQENELQAAEIETLRSRATLSQQNWIKERDELISREAYTREEFENAKQAMQDWEALALNERQLHDNLKRETSEVEEQLEGLRDAYQKAAAERDQNSEAVEGLQKALQQLQHGKALEHLLWTLF